MTPQDRLRDMEDAFGIIAVYLREIMSSDYHLSEEDARMMSDAQVIAECYNEALGGTFPWHSAHRMLEKSRFGEGSE